MKINDELLDALGDYFVSHNILARYGITFEEFLHRWQRGILSAWGVEVNDGQTIRD